MLCAMLISGTYFAHLRQQQLGWMIAGHLIGALIGYIAAEMLIRKTWLILTRKAPLEFAGYAALLGLVLYIPVSGLTGYENRVPAADQVVGVYAGDRYAAYGAYWNDEFSPKGEDPLTADRDYIEAVRKLHQEMVSARPEHRQGMNYREFSLVYKLDNGRTLNRTYLVPAVGFEPELRTVMESEGYKRKAYMLSRLDGDIEGFRLSNYTRALSISDPQEVTEFKDILKREILNMTYEDQTDDERSYAGVQSMGKPEETGYQLYYNYDWRASFKELTAWLEQKGYAEKVRTNPLDFSSVEIVPNDYFSRFTGNDRYDPERHLELARSEDRAAEITDTEAISDILEHTHYYSASGGDIW